MAQEYDSRRGQIHDEGVREEDLKRDLASSASSMDSPGQEMQSSRIKYAREAQDIVSSQTTTPTEKIPKVTVDFRDFVRNEEEHSHKDTRKTHLERLKKAMSVIEEEIKHLASEEVKS